MSAVVVAAVVAFGVSLLGTPLVIRMVNRLGYGQPIRDMGIEAHEIKRGTPTMGGWVLIIATIIAYVVVHLISKVGLAEQPGHRFLSTTGVVLLGLFLFMGMVGCIDDYLKVSRKNSDGLHASGKLLGQLLVGGIFGIIALTVPGVQRQTVGSDAISFARDIDWLHVGKVGAVVMFIVVVLATSNGVNLTDGLDGLATGSSIMVLASYSAIGSWQYRHWCGDESQSVVSCYGVRDPLEIAIIAIAAAGACGGFLWWNASPAKIIMGDTGALGLGALIGGLAMATHTVLLLPMLGALFVIITMSVAIQFISFQVTGRYVFKMAPLHHHFELLGWSEVDIVTRFWIISAGGMVTGLTAFYADFLLRTH